MKISPIDRIILNIIATVLKEKSTLVRMTETMYDYQFMHLLGLRGIPMTRTLIGDTMNYLEELGLIARVNKVDNYVGMPVHYILTEEGYNSL